jgi:hypothetical protein
LEQVFPILILIVVVIMIVFAVIQAKQRAQEMREWGERNGLKFTPKDRHMDDAFPQYSCLRHGHSRYAKNILTGAYRGSPICAFDYHYTTGSGKSQQHHSFSALMVNTGLPLKQLFIRTEHFFDKVAEFVGFDDIDFESVEFSREFYVKSPDKKWAYDVLHQKSMEYLLHAPRYTLDFQGPYIMAYRNRKFEIAKFDEAFTVIKNLLDLLPDYLMRELKGEIS